MIKAANSPVHTPIQQLKDQLEAHRLEELDYVFIVHPDPQLANQLRKGFANQAIAMVSISQCCWNVAEEGLQDLVGWCLENLTVKGVVLVGHSQGGTPSDQIQVCDSENPRERSAESTNRITSFLDRVKQADSERRENEAHFRSILDQLQQSEVVQTRSPRNGALVQGLFYRAESGVFCHLDAEQSQLQAIVATV